MRTLQSSSASHGRGTPSYFADEPGALFPPPGSPALPSLISPGLAETPLTDEGFTFRHFPAENVNPTSVPFASNPKATSILRCRTHSSQLAMVSDPPTSVIPEGDPVQVISGSVPISPDDTMVRTQPLQSAVVAEGKPSYASASSDGIFAEESWEGMDGPESHLGFALSGLTHLGPVRDAFKRSGAPISGSSFGRDHSERSNRSKSKHDEQPQGSKFFQEQPKIISPEKSDKEISSAASSFSVTTRSSQESGSPIVTMRFEHREDENGHHVLTGREGTLTRCQDEPIRVPGAVQGFGVLMVLHDDRTTCKLPVRQVSEVGLFLDEPISSQFLPELQCDPWPHAKLSLQPRLLHSYIATKPSRPLLGLPAGARRTRLRPG